MSSTGLWVVGVLPDEEARTLPDRYIHLVRPGDWQRPPGFGETLAWWSNGGDQEPFFEHPADPSGPLIPTPTARRFADFFNDANRPTEATEAMRDASMTLTPEAEGAGLFVATARKAKPAAALCYGLGAERSAMFPGWFGDFLLSAEEVRTALPRAEEALDLATTQRSEVLSRITAWMTAMGDAPDFDAAELIDAPLQVLRFAAETGSGATAFSRWY
ncbi:hypothetical protein ACWD4L_21980 [Streptomyces sp. NPDC002596]|uniref:hypothetical protein n=1 Tax=Streptomyces sp. NPDC059460 TaxID=3346840 RepID=UPI00367A9DEC